MAIWSLTRLEGRNCYSFEGYQLSNKPSRGGGGLAMAKKQAGCRGESGWVVLTSDLKLVGAGILGDIPACVEALSRYPIHLSFFKL